MTDNPVFRRRCFLRATANKMEFQDRSRYQLNLPTVLIEKLNWKIDDKLKVDILKSGMEYTIRIVREQNNK